MNWSEKYKPTKFTDLVYPEDIHLKCLELFKKMTPTSVLVISGPVGSGKSTLVRIMCNLFKYNIVSSISNTSSSTLDKKKNILVLEDVEQNFRMSKSRLPTIITSTYKLNILNALFINLKKHDYDQVKLVVDRISKKEGKILNNKIISLCNYDLRSVINNMQVQNTSLISSGDANFYDIFRRHMKWKEFEKRSTNFVYSAYISEASREASEAFSIFDIVGEEYYYLPLSRVNQRRNWNIQIVKNTNTMKKVDPYFALVNLKTTSEENIFHIQEILKRKCVTFEETEEINNIKKYKKGTPLVVKAESSGVFKFRFKKGVSKFSKRYLTLDEFLNL